MNWIGVIIAGKPIYSACSLQGLVGYCSRPGGAFDLPLLFYPYWEPPITLASLEWQGNIHSLKKKDFPHWKYITTTFNRSVFWSPCSHHIQSMCTLNTLKNLTWQPALNKVVRGISLVPSDPFLAWISRRWTNAFWRLCIVLFYQEEKQSFDEEMLILKRNAFPFAVRREVSPDADWITPKKIYEFGIHPRK